MNIIARVEANGRKLGVVEIDGGYQLRDCTHSESGHALGTPLSRLEYAMRQAHEILFGVTLIPREPAAPSSRDSKAAEYFSGNERALGAGPERS